MKGQRKREAEECEGEGCKLRGRLLLPQEIIFKSTLGRAISYRPRKPIGPSHRVFIYGQCK